MLLRRGHVPNSAGGDCAAFCRLFRDEECCSWARRYSVQAPMYIWQHTNTNWSGGGGGGSGVRELAPCTAAAAAVCLVKHEIKSW